MKAKIFYVVLAVVVTMVFIGNSISQAADVGGMIKEQKQKVTEKAGASQEVTGSDIHAKIKAQQQLIDKTKSAGTLNKKEMETVQTNLNNIKHRHERMLADKKMDDTEQTILSNMLDQNQKMITDKKSNPVKSVRPDPQIRIDNQQKRIDHGVKTGKLTKKEAEVVQDNLNRIKEKYVKMKQDGKLTADEEDKIFEKLNKNYDMIENKEKNAIKKID